MSLVELEQVFQDKIDKDIRIEPRDWMPDKYRQTLSGRLASMRTAKL